ncbi:hypothetical protein [Actinocorallia longicatena]|uniref:Uncharacterized protein n=1 Tax=Actinocorallia longicatena TaxID=111803 RepID=A0ABP6QJ58_9ACTN
MSTEPTPGTKIAEALRRSPVHLDPSLASALPTAERTKLLDLIRRAPMPVFVVIVPLVKGSTWDDPDQLATVVHDRLGRDGVYVTLGGSDRQLSARRWGGTRQEADDAAAAARVPFFLPEFREAPLAARLLKAVELIAAGGGEAAYDKATAHLRSYRTTQESGEDGGLLLPLTAGGAVLAAAGALVVWRGRRMASRPVRGQRLPVQALAAAERADADALRGQAERELLARGARVDEASVASDDPRVHELLGLALDAYQAAAKIFDTARGIPDLAGVLVLADRGRDALDSARAVAAKGKEQPPTPLCFFNPLHGDGPVSVRWRALGTRTTLKIRCCADCAKAVRDHRTPRALTDIVDGEAVPYFTASSLWASTGYGQFGDDLVQRVVRGDR